MLELRCCRNHGRPVFPPLRQYDLARLAQELGWRSDQICVIDEDQTRSACTTEGRSGFHFVMSEVALGQVGAVLAIEASRLARNNADWQRLVLYCRLADTLLRDQDGLYDPSRLDDRMVLGPKGTISELEWHTIRKRLLEARVHRARRGEVELVPPVGFEWRDAGGLEITPDRQVVDALRPVACAGIGVIELKARLSFICPQHSTAVPRLNASKVPFYKKRVWTSATIHIT
jgi:DNA invertase Pin-like site-specific DNA recombinase